MGTLVSLRSSTCCSCRAIFFVAIYIKEVPSIAGTLLLSTTPMEMYEVWTPRATRRHTEPTMGRQPPVTSWNIDANSPNGCSWVSSGSNCRLISVGPLPVSRMARVVRSKPSFRNNLTISLQLEEGMNTHAVPSGGFPWDTPGGRFGQFFPALWEDLYLLVSLRVVGGGGTTAPDTRFPRRTCYPGPTLRLPPLGWSVIRGRPRRP